MSLCVTLYESQSVQALFGTSRDGFRCLEADFRSDLIFQAQKLYALLGY